MSICCRKNWAKLAVFAFFSFTVSSVLAQSIDYSVVEKNIAAYEKKLRQLKDNLDNTIFDDQELVIDLDFDADEIIAFVKQKVAFQAYDGLLRGVQGTLVSRAGNALDQSVLLAKLLGDAGFDARIVEGQLSTELAHQLIGSIQTAALPKHIGKSESFEQALAAFDPKSVPAKDWANSQTQQRYLAVKNTLSTLLNDNKVKLKDIDVTAQFIQMAQAYFWVEYRLGASDPWQAAHPAFNNKQDLAVTPKGYFKGSVPEKYFHQVKIEAFIEQRIGDQLKTHSLMPAWEKPSANLFNVVITYSNQPSGIKSNQQFDFQQIMDNTRFFSPVFNGNPVGDQVFDMQGRLIDATAMKSAAGELFQTIGNKGLSAIEALNEKKPGEAPLMALNAQWLQFTFTDPNGAEYVQKRYLYQANETQDIAIAKTQLMAEYVLFNNTSEHSMAYLASVYLKLVQDSMPLFKASSNYVLNGNKKTQFPETLVTNGFELLAQYQWMNNKPNSVKNIIRYRANSNMVGIKRGYISAEKAFLAVDIINNKQNFIKQSAGNIFHTPQAAFEQGLWETASEWMPAKIMGLSDNDTDTIKITSAAQKQNLNLIFHHASNKDMSLINHIFADNPHALSRINADIQMGYSVVVPEHKPKDLLMSGWWRINTMTGETLGMTADGGGQSLTEYSIEVTQTALSMVRAIGNLKQCNKIKQAGAKVCCLMKAHINNVTGLAVGSFTGAVGGVLGSAIFDIVDFGKEMVTGSGIVPGVEFSCKGFEPIDDL